jgi:hypothetical protein
MGNASVVQNLFADRGLDLKQSKSNRKDLPFKDAVLGNYRSGRIEFEHRPDWPDGQRVAILLHLEGEPIGTGVPRVELPDGRIVPFNDSPEHCKLLAEHMGRPFPGEMMPEDDASFFAALEDMERWFAEGVRNRGD